ncbi:MAG: vWA domain-containing protein [Pseudomonadota bacterium]
MKWDKYVIIAVLGAIAFAIFQESNQGDPQAIARDPVTPNWAAIASWPGVEVDLVDARPDPNRRVTAIVLDDSGSMGEDIGPAKAAVVSALEAMDAEDRVAVLALNAGTVLTFSSVSDAQSALPDLLRPISSDGGTPLARAIGEAQAMLESEAATVRGFGTFRLIVTTDGQADDGRALDSVIETLAASTPIQVTTIGIGISGGHVLRRDDLGSFVDVANVAALADALQAAVAENTDFTAITDFQDTGG